MSFLRSPRVTFAGIAAAALVCVIAAAPSLQARGSGELLGKLSHPVAVWESGGEALAAQRNGRVIELSSDQTIARLPAAIVDVEARGDQWWVSRRAGEDLLIERWDMSGERPQRAQKLPQTAARSAFSGEIEVDPQGRVIVLVGEGPGSSQASAGPSSAQALRFDPRAGGSEESEVIVTGLQRPTSVSWVGDHLALADSEQLWLLKPGQLEEGADLTRLRPVAYEPGCEIQGAWGEPAELAYAVACGHSTQVVGANLQLDSKVARASAIEVEGEEIYAISGSRVSRAG